MPARPITLNDYLRYLDGGGSLCMSDWEARYGEPEPLEDWERDLLATGEVNEAPVTAAPRIMPRCSEPNCTMVSCQRRESDFIYVWVDGSFQETRASTGTHDLLGYDRDGYNLDGYNERGYDRDGYDRRGFDQIGLHRETGRRFDSDGYDRYGYNRNGYDRNGYDVNGYDSDGYDSRGNDRCDNRTCDCCDHYDDYYRDDSALESYSYTPRLRFHGDTGPYYGMEIEVTTDEISEAVRIVNEHNADTPNKADDGHLIYCKSDSSVEGMEMVTHPMSYAWAMEHFPWELLPALRSRANATVVESDNGIHVHVGRAAFDNSAHLYRWFKLWYRNPSDMQRIGRRNSDGWGAFNSSHRRAQKDHVKYGKPGYDSSNDRTLSRYSAINTTNDKTLEVRIFASSLRPQRVKAALGLVAASVEYTRQLTAEDVSKRNGWTWQAFMAWVRKSGDYPDLVAEDKVRVRR